jgi:hypothetical protein
MFLMSPKVITVQREYRVKFYCRKAPRTSAINSLVKCETAWKAIDSKKGVVGKKSLKHQHALTQSPVTFVKCFS